MPTTTTSTIQLASSASSTAASLGQSESHSSASPSSSSQAPQQQQHAFETIIAAEGASSDFALMTEDEEKEGQKDGQDMKEGRRSDVDDDRALVSETEAKLGLNDSSDHDNRGDVSSRIRTRTSDIAPNTSTSSSASSSSMSSSALLIFGGMDTEGEIYDDCLLIKL